MKTSPGVDQRILRRMKYTSDQQGIMNRYLAEGDNWENHLGKTKEFIIQCLEKSKPKSVAVMGSGWLLDIPFQFICENFKEVYLLDVVHPPQVIHKARSIENVHMVSADITGGGIEAAYKLVKKYRKTGSGSILDIACQASLAGVPADFIISLNVLNQLDILLVDYITRFMKISDSEKNVFRERIQRQHLNLLKPGHSCIISDIEERVLDRENQVISTRSLVYTPLPHGTYRQEWTWTFDTRGEYTRGNKTEMLVKAIEI